MNPKIDSMLDRVSSFLIRFDKLLQSFKSSRDHDPISPVRTIIENMNSLNYSEYEKDIYISLTEIIGMNISKITNIEKIFMQDAIFQRMLKNLHPDSLLIAEILALEFQRIIADESATLPDICKFYDVLYGLYWCGAQRLTDMQRFDTKVVFPFSEFLRKNYPPQPSMNSIAMRRDTLKVGYICTYANSLRGNAVAPLIKSMAIEHQKKTDRDVFVYCVQWATDDFINSFDGSGVTVKALAQGNNFTKLPQLAEIIRRDGIDILITDIGSPIASFLFSQRVALVQMWVDMGFPFWSTEGLDWVLLPSKDYQPYFGIPKERYTPLRLRQHLNTLVHEVSEKEIELARMQIPKNSFLMASFARKIKFTPQYIRIVRKLLKTIPDSHLLIVGSGFSYAIDTLIKDDVIKKQITIISEMVDLNVYGTVIDVFLDTFPFIGGLAVREICSAGTPVISMLSGDWDRLVYDERDVNLVAASEDEYHSLVVRLSKDREFYMECVSRAKTLEQKYTNMDDMMDDIELGISQALEYVCKQ